MTNPKPKPKLKRKGRRPHYETPFCAIPSVQCCHEGCSANPNSPNYNKNIKDTKDND